MVYEDIFLVALIGTVLGHVAWDVLRWVCALER